MLLSEIIMQTLRCLEKFILYIIPCVVILLILYKLCRVPKFIFRKCLHVVAFSCVTVMIVFGESWIAAVLASVVIIIVVYPLLSAAEHIKGYADLFVQKSPGEVKRSLVMLFGMFAVLTAVSWGIFNNPEAGAAAILMWGIGDAAAALIGIPFGKHKVSLADGHKSYEGSLAMLLFSSLFGFLFLYLHSGLSPATAAAASISGAAAGTLTELFSASEYDTVTVPAAILTVLLIIVL